MFVLVRLLKGYPQPLTYKIPESWNTKPEKGCVVTVPIKNRTTQALVIGTYKTLPFKSNFEIKEALTLEELPRDENYKNFINKIANFYFVKPVQFYQRIRSFVHSATKSASEIVSQPLDEAKNTPENVSLTSEQQVAFDKTLPFIKKPQYAPTLLHGVTGSGKTEIYKKLIIECIKKNKTVILLHPEVTLSLQFQNLLQKQLPADIQIFGFHSACKVSEKKLLWQYLLQKKPCVIVGVHLPIMLPIPNLGLIIVDEEHETGFQEKKHPKLNSKEIALWRAKLYKIPIILGSATPSINSIFNAKQNNWNHFKLTKRFSGEFPTIQKVSLCSDPSKKSVFRKNFWISTELENSIADRLEKKEQTLIFLNRRGHSFFVQCKLCGFTFTCPHCSVSLTLHKGKTEFLRCHYCNYAIAYPKNCTGCKASEKNFLKKGIGTQQVVTILEKMFPAARIARADLDTTTKKRSWAQTVENFTNGSLDILVGTQTITKGYHFPKVTLVGVLWADLNVNFPVFNAQETALQQLIQVAGRAGRQSSSSLVIIQTIHDSPIFNFLNEQDYQSFCNKEARVREETLYPPFGRFVQIEIKNDSSEDLETDTNKIFDNLYKTNEEKKLGVLILGPAKPLVYRIQKTEMRHIFLKSKSFKRIYDLMYFVDLEKYKSKVFVVPTQ
jgi:primosomal protein N' (replication factor Y) (superfamily II helicase)